MRNYFWGSILVIIGILLLLDHLDVLEFRDVIHNYWPLILIFWGLSILIRKKTFGPTTEPDTSQHIDYDLMHQSSVFGDVHTSITSQNFKGGSVSTIFGNSMLDLSKSSFEAGEHILRVSGVFGDTSIILPKDAAVSISASTVFGSLTILGQKKSGISNDIQITSPNYSSSPNRLKVSVGKVFGNVRVN